MITLVCIWPLQIVTHSINLDHVDCIREIIYYDSDYDSLIKVKNKKGKLAKDLTLKKKCFDSIFTSAREGDVNTIRNLLN